MALWLKHQPPPDYIFIGNSHTLFHMSTQIMHQYGLFIYNYGLSGHETPDFPAMVAQALRYHPKAIVICLAAAYLHTNPSATRDLDATDLWAYFKSGMDPRYIGNELVEYIKNLFLIETYATNINLRIRTAYQAFDFNGKLSQLANIKSGFQNPLFNNARSASFDKAAADCKIFETSYPKNQRAIVMCTNGDGIIFGHNQQQLATPQNQIPNNVNDPINESQLRLLNYVLNTIKQAGVKPIVIFTPIYKNPYSRQFTQQTAQRIQAPVIDLTSDQFDQSMWAELSHLNVKGRAAYTRIVAKKLQQSILKSI